jgi:hypothetical protein
MSIGSVDENHERKLLCSTQELESLLEKNELTLLVEDII